ncbi:DUF1826 domain-containing protein [Parasphingorhabdus cellanae]|uniref:DUF1826 domain-containing protein n=1 Tax=Parasphingorhabdus cellanae TaxID=2806553 RepID=A0ABX7T5M2_9SPHN|nr:DUF1826 domain-containing protein [Parasphingorhabdus cellanae]QTD56889.1 DUF1826 domain-containing protein [Parasphingorhabdus cellanae]
MSVDAKERSIAFTARNPKALRAIRVEGVGIAIWERSAPPGLSDLKLDGIVDVRFTADIDELPAMLDSALDDAGHEKSVARDILHNDILVLANRFAQIMQNEFVEIRLECVTTNACKKFHTDYVTARLITTYLGQGTQWLDSEDTADSDCGDLHNIQQMQAGDVALFKGRLWSRDKAGIHRSPPIEGTGEERLLLVINPARLKNAI